MSASRVIVLACILALAAGVLAGEFEHPHVVDLKADTFDEQVANGSVYFIKFYAPWCGHCKHLAPVWGELAEAVAGNDGIKIAHVDCTNARAVCQEAEIKGYPTLKAYYKGEDIKSYKGARDLKALKAFIEETAEEMLSEV